ncbi:hypothetical protein [Sphingomonas abaci]|uniref:Uncharacterized protein n=1 Tax=Sphingomonas abaci TaxID=237611 RepID=A0A7W7EWU6_9SPHN|nr:hypothetical protein [Sphingomonas abaci]MBB4616907.1 hypothetical protein [Sphingomonas abaci]
MDDEDRITAGVSEAVLKLIVRAGVVSEDDVLAIASEYDTLAGRAPQHEVGVHEMVAHRLRCVLLDLDPPPAVDPAREFEAQFQREQIRLRTAMIARKAKDTDNA